ncbi:helix-turn-helix DNA-binding protein [Mycobacterium phage Eaglehorse]|uniref:Helix-turn-helix DNA-binding protein n=1 Tax=Mycobacterium phage Eaglehorse TaxID=2301611 RepID=A0A385UDY8_9CAUD|nr:helix-turn-helix DNA-binding protein [Mycobacterium phage Eaglehorse]
MSVALADDGDDGGAIERPVDETLWERRMQAVSLRNAGMTFSEIARIQGISPALARRDVETALREFMSGEIDQLIARHRSVLMDMQRANYRAMLSGSKEAATTILKGLEHEAKLLGLYAPTRVVTGVGEVEFSERFVQLVNAISPDTLKELLRGAQHTGEPRQHPVDAEVVPDPVAETPGGAGAEAGPGGEAGGADAAPAREPAPDHGGDDSDGWSNL